VVKEEKTQAVGLRREMGLMAAINVIIGVMIGSGIFISPQAALEHSGSIGACIIVWISCGVISLLGALCFAELGTVRISHFKSQNKKFKFHFINV
jgi:solute carrier family 7 (L-type amino acid transporter), member 9/15